MRMLDLDPTRSGPEPRDAATLVVVRDAKGGAGGVEVFCVERQKGGFLGGAIVFPGGKLDAEDTDPGWRAQATAPRATSAPLAADEGTAHGLAVAACREALEEAAILPVTGPAPAHEELLGWRAALRARAAPASLRALLSAADRKLDLFALHALARWVTPATELRRFDTRFFLYVATPSLEGRHDGYETTASFWSTPSRVLERFGRGELLLAPPTHRTLEILASARDAAAAAAIAEESCLEPICPELVAQGDVMALALPGDPQHSVRAARSPGQSRYVLRDGRFLPEDAPRA
jgi:8-oxo-dGTP pyrophosphatase MutT (NUDIX family)